MKQVTISLVTLLLSSATVFAQDAEDEPAKKPEETVFRIPTGFGNYMVGANLLFGNATYQKGFDASYNAGINPKLGVFVLPNIALGLSLDLGIQGNKTSRTITYGASPFARVYFSHDNAEQPSRPLQFFIEGGVGVGGTNSRYDANGGTTTASTNGIRLYALPGIDYFINNHIAVELGLEYLFIGGHPNANIFGLNVGFQIFLPH